MDGQVSVPVFAPDRAVFTDVYCVAFFVQVGLSVGAVGPALP